jgi:hypothetical protein
MPARILLVLATLAGGLAAVPAWSADQPIGRAEVSQLVGGKTLMVQFVDPMRLELGNDGQVQALGTASAIRAIGTWSIDDKGRLCIKSPNPVLAGCRAIMRGERGLGMTKTDGTGFFLVSEIR